MLAHNYEIIRRHCHQGQVRGCKSKNGLLKRSGCHGRLNHSWEMSLRLFIADISVSLCRRELILNMM